MRLVHAVLEKADVIHLTMDVARFRYKPGQYLYLSCPSLGTTEWHPFTITSAPEQLHVTVHIRTRGDWTRRLMDHVCPSLDRQESASGGSKRNLSNFTSILSRRNSKSSDTTTTRRDSISSDKGNGLLKGSVPLESPRLSTPHSLYLYDVCTPACHSAVWTQVSVNSPHRSITNLC